MGERELSADLFAGKYFRRNRGSNNRDCRDEEKTAVIVESVPIFQMKE